jgi:hypothetical protein
VAFELIFLLHTKTITPGKKQGISIGVFPVRSRYSHSFYSLLSFGVFRIFMQPYPVFSRLRVAMWVLSVLFLYFCSYESGRGDKGSRETREYNRQWAGGINCGPLSKCSASDNSPFTTALCLPQVVVVATLCCPCGYPLGNQGVSGKAPQPNHNQSKG